MATDRAAPTWRDVLRVFVAAGPYLLRRETKSNLRFWLYETAHRFPGGSRTEVRVMHNRDEGTWVISYVGPNRVALTDPSPADVLTAARLVGLEVPDGN